MFSVLQKAFCAVSRRQVWLFNVSDCKFTEKLPFMPYFCASYNTEFSMAPAICAVKQPYRKEQFHWLLVLRRIKRIKNRQNVSNIVHK